MKKWILPILMAGFLLTGCSSPAATSSALPSSAEKITETQMTEEPGTLEETETGTATETQQEPVIQTVKITAARRVIDGMDRAYRELLQSLQ